MYSLFFVKRFKRPGCRVGFNLKITIFSLAQKTVDIIISLSRIIYWSKYAAK